MKFLPYNSKPVVRMAFQITEQHNITKIGEATYHCSITTTDPVYSAVLFKAYEEPKVGDWIVRLTEEDTYHCTDAVFRERNIVDSICKEPDPA